MRIGGVKGWGKGGRYFNWYIWSNHFISIIKTTEIIYRLKIFILGRSGGFGKSVGGKILKVFFLRFKKYIKIKLIT